MPGKAAGAGEAWEAPGWCLGRLLLAGKQRAVKLQALILGAVLGKKIAITQLLEGLKTSPLAGR